MNCPHCNKDSLDETDDFDLTIIDNEECQHDFKCSNCGRYVTITYRAHEARVIQIDND